MYITQFLGTICCNGVCYGDPTDETQIDPNDNGTCQKNER